MRHRNVNAPRGITADNDGYFRDIVDALRPTNEWLVMGPSTTKLRLIKYIFRQEQPFTDRIVGVESAEHETDPRIAQLARHYFMTPP